MRGSVRGRSGNWLSYRDRYGNANLLIGKGIFLVCVDEMPNCQVLERQPLRRAIPGSIEQQEFEYKRHGTVNILPFLIVHTGLMGVAISSGQRR
jgi:hypothetical protein